VATKVASFGGGPGTDAAGLVWAQRELYRDDMLSTTLYDVEGSWKRYMKTLGELFGDGVPLAFQPCDVTKPLPDKANAKVAAAEADRVLFFYVCNETGAGEEDNPRLDFYAGLAKKAKPGAVVVLVDVARRSEAALAAVTAAMAGVRRVKPLALTRTHNAQVVAFRLEDGEAGMVAAGEAKAASPGVCRRATVLIPCAWAFGTARSQRLINLAPIPNLNRSLDHSAGGGGRWRAAGGHDERKQSVRPPACDAPQGTSRRSPLPSRLTQWRGTNPPRSTR
jgi:hypothetical protein